MMTEMRGRAKLVGLGTALPTLAVVVHGCKDPTQITVEVKTHVVCADMRGVDVVAASDPRRAEERAALLTTGPRFPSGSTTACTEGPAPREVGTLVITPNGDSGAVVVIAAFGQTNVKDCVAPQLPARCIIARRRFSFVENRRISMPIVLDPDCAGVPCNENSTCVGKKCVDSAVDCTGAECTQPGVAADGGIIEVDAFSPLVDGAPPDDDGSIPSDGSPGDGSANDGGASDGGDGSIDGSFDAGGGYCPGIGMCLPGESGLGSTCTGGGRCCYANGGSACVQASDKNPCGGLTACCNGSSVCEASMVCCPDTPTPQVGTVIACRPYSECKGPVICSSGDMDCRGHGTCQTTFFYSHEPDYFGCS